VASSKWAMRQEERDAPLCSAPRRDVTPRGATSGCEIWATDVCVPISRLAECILESKKDLKTELSHRTLVEARRRRITSISAF